jgi:predicted metal-dependent TIM-barrel fold hydrolase
MTDTRLADVARAAGDKLVLASDAGQPNSPPPPQALAELIDRLKSQGLDRKWIEAAAAEIPEALVLA